MSKHITIKRRKFAVVRHRPPGEFSGRQAFFTTHAREGAAQWALEQPRLKGDQERLLSELLSELDLHHPPCMDLRANRSFGTRAGLAWHLLPALRLWPRPLEEAPQRMRTLLRQLLVIPGDVKRHARQLKACR